MSSSQRGAVTDPAPPRRLPTVLRAAGRREAGGRFGQRKGSGEGKVAAVLRSRGLGTEWHSRLFLSFQCNQPSSQMFMAAHAIHQGWAQRWTGDLLHALEKLRV